MTYTLCQVYVRGYNIVYRGEEMAYTVEKFGDHRERRNYSKAKNAIELGNLLEIQKNHMTGLLVTELKKYLKMFFLWKVSQEI